MKLYGKTNQFRHFVRELPKNETVNLHGTVKLHGTHGAIHIEGGKVEFYSRNNKLDTHNDNAGFFNTLAPHSESILETYGDNITLYGEWAGEGIQKGVGISKLPKTFYVFAIRPKGGTRQYNFRLDESELIRNINNFKTFSVQLDTSNPAMLQNELVKLTEEVEKDCPVAGGLGEGIVWSYEDKIFKVKGEKHSVSKVKKLASVDPEKLASIEEFVNYTATENRLVQGLENVEPKQENIGKFIQWFNRDIYNEEKDTLEASGLTMKDVSGRLATVARKFIMEKL